MSDSNLNKWDAEYRSRGIPSSFRNEPSGTLVWVLTNWRLLTGHDLPQSAVDIGCGGGRNPLYMAEVGINVLGFDSSEVALQSACERQVAQGFESRAIFKVHDLSLGIPAEDGQFDLATDIFVYKHQLLPSARAAYRRELKRVLRPSGRVLLSLAERMDGYYNACPEMSIEEYGNPRTVNDPVVGIGSVLFTLPELTTEMEDVFTLEMSWNKIKMGLMHGKEYERHTLATIWKLKD